MTGQATRTFSLTLERLIRAPRGRVFEAWTTPEQMKRWSAPEGFTIPRVEVDLRVGGRYRIEMQEPEGGARHVAVGEYREVTPPSRLVYTWSWETDGTPHETVITVDFRDEGDATRVLMAHEGFVDIAERDSHDEGWSSSLNRLESLFEEG